MGTHRFTEPEEVPGKQHYLKHCLASMERETSGRLGGMVLQTHDWIKKQKSISLFFRDHETWPPTMAEAGTGKTGSEVWLSLYSVRKRMRSPEEF